MYKEFYLMQKEPFDSHPSPELFYKSTVHQTAWHYLVQGIKQHEAILVLAGDYGAGKTLLFLKLVRLLEKKGRLPIVAVPSPTCSFATVLEKVVEKLLDISPGSIDATDESTLQQAVYEHFEKVENRSPIYMIIDDAQEFSYSFINKLRLFASYNCDGFFPIRLIFFAHHSFLKMLDYKKLVALGQRIKRIYHLKPLTFEETKEYIYYRLIHSGATGTPIFNDEAIATIREVSGGNPRLINNVCDNCLLVAGEERVNLIDQNLVCLAMEKGNLTGLKDVDLPNSDPIVRPSSLPAQPNAQPMSGNGFQPTPVGPPEPLYAPQETYYQPPPQEPPMQASSFAPPHPVPGGGYQGPPQGPPMPQAPMPSNGQADPGNQYPSNVETPDNSQRFKASSPGFWEQYGKIVMIVILALVIIFLSSFLYNQYNAEKMFSMDGVPGKKVMKQVPAYTIDQDPPGRQFGQALEGQTGEKRNRPVNVFKPILLSGNVEG